MDKTISGEIVSSALDRLFFFFIVLLKNMNEDELELTRRASVATALLKFGADSGSSLFRDLYKDVKKNLLDDNAWRGVIETICVIDFLTQYDKNNMLILPAVKRLENMQNNDGGWGRFERDISRIPVCYFVLKSCHGLLSEESKKRCYTWMKNEWIKDLNHQGFTYKAAFFLMSSKLLNKDNELIKQTVNYLISQREKDNGWSVVKDHPIGSVPSYTAHAISALIEYNNYLINPQAYIAESVNFILKNQLDCGAWKEHYIDTNSSVTGECLLKYIVWLK